MTKRAILIAGALIAGAWLAGQANAQAPRSATVGGRSGVVIAERVTLAATVEDIDRGQRLMTLKVREDKTIALHVPEEVKNFDQINVGDTVEAEFLSAVAIGLRPAGTPATSTEATTVKVVPWRPARWGHGGDEADHGHHRDDRLRRTNGDAQGLRG
jgi:hypothetical protein